MAEARMVSMAGVIGGVEAYALERIVPATGSIVTCSALFDDYRRWCVEKGLAPLREALFVDAFEDLAREVGIPLRQRGSNMSFVDVALASADDAAKNR